jgi:DNA-binding HxlR family transcriptional regulator
MDEANAPAESFDSKRLFELLSGRWRLEILGSLTIRSPQRLSELRQSVPGISKKVLLDNLRVLQQAGILGRKDLSSKVKRVEYSLSEPARLAVGKVLAAAQELRATVENQDKQAWLNYRFGKWVVDNSDAQSIGYNQDDALAEQLVEFWR